MDENLILSVKNLDITFLTNAGKIHAIRGVDIFLPKGKTVAIVGESGSGKSVTMKAVTGLLDSNAVINAGNIFFRDAEKIVDLLTLTKRDLRKNINGKNIAMVFQDPMTSLNPTMTIGAQIMEGMFLHQKISEDDAKNNALKLLNLVGINDAEKRFKNYPHQLSGGMRQRVVIAIALASSPKILI
ncbi:MAG: ABC transporter ATP-binding protein, partial [Selenomonadaceae bacterium]|nr:ABC transporter ATP-binding protein [Selenomonadaceae bacterium]